MLHRDDVARPDWRAEDLDQQYENIRRAVTNKGRRGETRCVNKDSLYVEDAVAPWRPASQERRPCRRANRRASIEAFKLDLQGEEEYTNV